MPQRSLVVNFIGDTAALEKSFARVSTGLTGIEAAGKRVSTLGSTMTRNLTVPIVGLGAAAAKMSIDFQAATERLHTQAGVSQQAVAGLSQGILSLAGQVGESPKALADGMYHVASSLNSTLPPSQRASTELKVLRIAAEGASVGNANLVDVTNALDAAIVSGIKGVSNYSQAMGALNAIVGAGDMSMQDLADSLGTGLLAAMKTFGLTLTDVGGALDVFGKNNIRGADAATKLISAVRIMAAPSKAAAKELAGVHLSTLQLANDMRQGGIVKALTDLKTHLTDAGLTASQQGLVITRAFGGRQSIGIHILLGQLNQLGDVTKQVAAGAGGFAQAWSATQLTASHKTKEALATMEADLTRFGTEALPTLLSAGSTIVKDVDKVAHAFSSLPKGAQDAIITGGLITAGVGPALKLVGLVTGLVGKSWGLMRGLAGLAGLGKGGGGLLGGKSLSQTVGTMEVGTLIAKSMVGGGGTGPLSRVGKDAGLAAGAGGASLRSDLAGTFSSAAKIGGGMLAATFASEVFSQVVQNAAAHRAASVQATLNLPASVVAQLTQATGPKGYPIMSPVRTNLPYGDQGNILFSLAQGAIKQLDAGGGTKALDAVIQRARELEKLFPQNQAALDQFIAALSTMDRKTNITKFTLGIQQATDAFQKMNAKLGGSDFASRLAAEFSQGRTASSQGVRAIVGELRKLPPAAEGQAGQAMIELAQQLERKGLIAKGSAAHVRGMVMAEIDKLSPLAGAQAALAMASLANGIKTGGDLPKRAAADVATSIETQFKHMAASVETSVAAALKSAGAVIGVLPPFGQLPKHPTFPFGQLPQHPTFPSAPASDPSSPARHPSAAELQALGLQTKPKAAAAAHWHWNPFDRHYEMLTPSAWTALEARIYGAKNSGTALPTATALRVPRSRVSTTSSTKTPAWLTATLGTIKSQTTADQIQAQAAQNAVAAAQNSQDLGRANALLARELKLEQGFLTADRQQLRKVNEVLAKRHLTASQRQKVQSAKLALLNEIGSVQGTIGGLQSSLTGAGSSGAFDLAPGNIKLPTLYDIGQGIRGPRPSGLPRGSTHHATHHHATHVHNHNNIRLEVRDSKDVPKVVDVLERATGAKLSARLKAAGVT